MPRRPRVFVEGGIYHVYNRFARGADLFSEPEEAIEFIEILRKVRDRDDLNVYAWTLMLNHYHLAVRTGPVPLSRTLGYVQASSLGGDARSIDRSILLHPQHALTSSGAAPVSNENR